MICMPWSLYRESRSMLWYMEVVVEDWRMLAITVSDSTGQKLRVTYYIREARELWDVWQNRPKGGGESVPLCSHVLFMCRSVFTMQACAFLLYVRTQVEKKKEWMEIKEECVCMCTHVHVHHLMKSLVHPLLPAWRPWVPVLVQKWMLLILASVWIFVCVRGGMGDVGKRTQRRQNEKNMVVRWETKWH